jgi:aspartyl-tRNA(Asn)/glutamyl-tRNA(Gln) amidotransferase subunit A
MVLETVALDDLRERPARGFDDALARLARAGAKITRGGLPELSEAMSLTSTLVTAEAYGIWGPTVETAPEKMFPRILERVRAGADVKASDYVAAWRRLRVIRNLWAEMSAGYDAVILPTAAILPPDANRLMTDFDYYISENLLSLRNTRIGNLMDVCALTLPTAEPSCGISFMAGPMQEDWLLRLGIAAERALA